MSLPKFSIMGVLNLTTDSFSDGGLFCKVEDALKQVDHLIEMGAHYIDLGAESTRPKALSVSVEEEWARLEPVLSEIEKRNLSSVKISVDTKKAEIMRRLLDHNIHMINHVVEETLSDDLLEAIAKRGVEYMAMHIYKKPKNMQDNPLDEEEALMEVYTFFESYQKRLLASGFKRESIYFDPGIGFGKTDRANLSLMNEVKNFSKDYQIAIGVSRKSFLGRTLGITSPVERDLPSKTLEIALTFLGAKIIRTHNIEALRPFCFF
jgi:dihydropteroate synthase